MQLQNKLLDLDERREAWEEEEVERLAAGEGGEGGEGGGEGKGTSGLGAGEGGERLSPVLSSAAPIKKKEHPKLDGLSGTSPLLSSPILSSPLLSSPLLSSPLLSSPLHSIFFKFFFRIPWIHELRDGRNISHKTGFFFRDFLFRHLKIILQRF
jgi:hypothetical protein